MSNARELPECEKNSAVMAKENARASGLDAESVLKSPSMRIAQGEYVS
jgi:hypothetical protein